MAKNTPKKVRTYASAVAGVTEKSIFSSLAKCQLKPPRHMPNARIPKTNEQHSFFIDLKSTDAKEEEVLAAITLGGIIGAHSRDDLWVVELICESDAVVEAAMNTVFHIEGKKPVEAIMPRHKTNQLSLIKIANVPFGNKQELTEKLCNYWTQYGTVVDAAPYMFPGKPWLTKRWDVLLMLNEGTTKLEAPPVFQIDGYEDVLVCSWVGAKKACLRCKSAGHSTSKCPVNNPKNQKVGEMANPLQKIGGVGQTQKRKEKGSEKLPGSTEFSKASSTSTASATTSATLASPATVATPIPAPSGSFTVTNPLGSSPSTSTASVAAPASFLGSELQRQQVTPPPLSRPDPDTPKKGNKRMSKDDDAWTPTAAEVRKYCEENSICNICCQKHNSIECFKLGRTPIAYHTLALTKKFRPRMEEWALARRKKGGSWRFYDVTAAGPYNPQICSRCHRVGHINTNCNTIFKCNHCSQNHLGIDCPDKPTYAFEAMDMNQ
jgi:hypothetical protein